MLTLDKIIQRDDIVHVAAMVIILRLHTEKFYLRSPINFLSPFAEKQKQPWKLHYGVKFFIPDPAKLKDDQSR